MVTETKSMSSSEPKEMSKSNTLVAEIVSDTKLAHAQRLSEAREKVAKSLFSVEVAQVRRIGEINQWINKEISELSLQSRRADLRVQRHVFKIVEYFVGSSGTISGDTKAAITSLV